MDLRFNSPIVRARASTPLALAVILALGAPPVAHSYDFVRPITPTLPYQLPSNQITVDGSTAANPGSSNPSSNYDWWGPTTNTLSNNDVHVSRSSLGYAYGGWSKAGNTVENNRVVLENSGRMLRILGGYSKEGDVRGNIVEVFGTTPSSDMPSIDGGRTQTGNATGNMVFVRQGAQVYGTLAGGKVSHETGGTAQNNIVVIESGASIGSSAQSTATVNAGIGTSANSNAVYVFGAAYGDVFGGQAKKGTGTANDNLVYVGSGAQVSGHAFAAYGALRSLSNASNNVLVIEDATVSGNAAAVSTNDYTGQKNELHLIGNAVVKGGAGANFDGWQSNAYRETTTGLVHINGTATVGSLEGFNELVFELTDANAETAALTITNAHKVIETGDPILDLTSVSTLIDAADLTDPSKGAVLIALKDGQSISLQVDGHTSFADESNVFVDQAWAISEAILSAGSIQADAMYINGRGELVSSLDGVETVWGGKVTTPTRESHTLAESLLGTVAFVNQGAEFIADEGLRAMVSASAVGSTAVFGAVHGGSSRYRTGSHVDVDGVTLVTGAVTRAGGLMLAGFVEAGWASSEGHVDGSKGDGDHDYYGLGAAVRYTFESPLYLDASLRFGTASTEFSGRYADASARYDADGLYGSMHAGAGWVFALGQKTNLDVYARYVLTYLEGDTVGLGTAGGETYDTKDTVTHAFRVGTRLTGSVTEFADWRAGLAYEHVADGDAKSDVIASGTRSALDVPTLEGDTGIVELGFSLRPSETSRWFADFSFKGYVGDRKGVSGNAAVGYTF